MARGKGERQEKKQEKKQNKKKKALTRPLPQAGEGKEGFWPSSLAGEGGEGGGLLGRGVVAERGHD